MKTLKITSGIIRFLIALAGFILMMCESEDLSKQIVLIVVGFIAFVSALLPTIIAQKKELDDYGDL